jgi:hypothetical protein
VPVTATITNSNSFHYWTHFVSAAYASDSKGCSSTAFQVLGNPATTSVAVPPKVGNTNGALAVTGLSVKFVGTGSCKTATVTLAYSIS